MFWVEIVGGVVVYLLLGIPMLRLMYILADNKEGVKDLASVLLAGWPLGLGVFLLIKLADCAFKWGKTG